jgi:hypothetical protein
MRGRTFEWLCNGIGGAIGFSGLRRSDSLSFKVRATPLQHPRFEPDAFMTAEPYTGRYDAIVTALRRVALVEDLRARKHTPIAGLLVTPDEVADRAAEH